MTDFSLSFHIEANQKEKSTGIKIKKESRSKLGSFDKLI